MSPFQPVDFRCGIIRLTTLAISLSTIDTRRLLRWKSMSIIAPMAPHPPPPCLAPSAFPSSIRRLLVLLLPREFYLYTGKARVDLRSAVATYSAIGYCNLRRPRLQTLICARSINLWKGPSSASVLSLPRFGCVNVIG